MKEYILCAAIHYDDGLEYENSPTQFGLVICGRRHSDCHNTLEALIGEHANMVTRDHQGFLTSENRYVGRKEAWHIAISNNQVKFGPTQTDENSILISENLY